MLKNIDSSAKPIYISCHNGVKFDIAFKDDDEDEKVSFKPVRELSSPILTSTSRKRRPSITNEEFFAKLNAAEQRRLNDIFTLKERLIRQNLSKKEHVHTWLNTNRRLNILRVRIKLLEKQTQTGQNRSIHLSKLQDRLKNRELHAEAVREKKQKLFNSRQNSHVVIIFAGSEHYWISFDDMKPDWQHINISVCVPPTLLQRLLRQQTHYANSRKSDQNAVEQRRFEDIVTRFYRGRLNFLEQQRYFLKMFQRFWVNRVDKLVHSIQSQMQQVEKNRERIIKNRCNKLYAKKVAIFVRQVQRNENEVEEEKNTNIWFLANATQTSTSKMGSFPSRLLLSSQKDFTLPPLMAKMQLIEQRRSSYLQKQVLEKLKKMRYRWYIRQPTPNQVEQLLQESLLKLQQSLKNREKLVKKRHEQLKAKRFQAFTQKVKLYVLLKEATEKLQIKSQQKMKQITDNRALAIEKTRKRLNQHTSTHVCRVRENKNDLKISGEYEIVFSF